MLLEKSTQLFKSLGSVRFFFKKSLLTKAVLI